MDTHALSRAGACASALEVLAANGVRRDDLDAATSTRRRRPSPTRSSTTTAAGRRARRRHRHHAVAQSAARTAASSTTRRTAGRRTPTITRWIEDRANELLAASLRGVQRIPYGAGARAPPRRIATTTSTTYIGDLDRSSTSTRSAARSSRWASIRSAARASTTGQPHRRALRLRPRRA